MLVSWESQKRMGDSNMDSCIPLQSQRAAPIQKTSLSIYNAQAVGTYTYPGWPASMRGAPDNFIQLYMKLLVPLWLYVWNERMRLVISCHTICILKVLKLTRPNPKEQRMSRKYKTKTCTWFKPVRQCLSWLGVYLSMTEYFIPCIHQSVHLFQKHCPATLRNTSTILSS